MIKYNLFNSMIGNQYPFFLNNSALKDSYYLYQILSPSLSPNCIPYISLTKISEKTKSEPYGNDSDIISICLGTKKNIEKTAPEFIESLLKKEDPLVEGNNKKFPLVEMENGNNLQKSIIIGLRDALRWKSYKFTPGHFVDILWTSKDFLVFEIKGDKETIWLEPVAAYRNTDVNLETPLFVDWSRVDYPKDKFIGVTKASDLNRIIKRIEWNSFDRRPFKKTYEAANVTEKN